VAKKHDFRDIQQKIPQNSDFTKNRDLNPTPHGDVAYIIAKMFAKKFSRKSDFGSKNTIFAMIRLDFCEIPRILSQKSDSAKNFFHDFCDFSATLRFLQNKYFYHGIPKNWIFRKTFSRFLLKSDRETANFPSPNCENRVFADYNSKK
jgi:hypothetical protein